MASTSADFISHPERGDPRGGRVKRINDVVNSGELSMTCLTNTDDCSRHVFMQNEITVLRAWLLNDSLCWYCRCAEYIFVKTFKAHCESCARFVFVVQFRKSAYATVFLTNTHFKTRRKSVWTAWRGAARNTAWTATILSGHGTSPAVDERSRRV